MSEPAFSRILLKLSGEVLANKQGFGIDPEKVHYLAKPVNIHPIGAITKGQAGSELSEMGLMFEAGAVAFSDDGLPDEKKIIKEIIDEFMSTRKKYSSYKEALAASFACKAAVKAGDQMTREEMVMLVNRLFATDHHLGIFLRLLRPTSLISNAISVAKRKKNGAVSGRYKASP